MGDRRNTKSQSNSQPYGPYMRKVGRRIGTSLLCGLCVTLGVNDAGQAETAQSSLAYIYPRDVGHIDQNLRAGETGRVKYVSRGDSFVMQDGLKVRLAGIQAPRPPQNPSNPSYATRPDFSTLAKTALAQSVKGQNIQLFYGGKVTRDRYQRAIAQAYIMGPDGEPKAWLQAGLVEAGLARVMTWPDTIMDVPKLYDLERAARQAGRGLWASPDYAVRSPDPDPLAQYVDSVQIIEGIITSVADVRGRIYLNFGANYKTDFTITIAKRDRKRFDKVGLDPLSLEGARVRVRGWVELYNGPVIWVDHPDRIEVLD